MAYHDFKMKTNDLFVKALGVQGGYINAFKVKRAAGVQYQLQEKEAVQMSRFLRQLPFSLPGPHTNAFYDRVPRDTHIQHLFF